MVEMPGFSFTPAGWPTFTVDGVRPAALTDKPSVSHEGVYDRTPFLAISDVRGRTASGHYSQPQVCRLENEGDLTSLTSGKRNTERNTGHHSRALCAKPSDEGFTSTPGSPDSQEHTKWISASALLHALFLLPGMLFRQVMYGLLPHFLQGSAHSSPFQGDLL